MNKNTLPQPRIIALLTCLLTVAVLLGCSKPEHNEPKPADEMTVPAPAPVTVTEPKPVSSTEEGYMTPPDDTYDNTEKKWAEIRSNEEKYLGEIVRFERLKVMSVYDDVLAHTRNLKYVRITGELGTYEFERGMGTANYIRLRQDDWIDVSGKFEGINSSGEILIQLKKIKNLGYKN